MAAVATALAPWILGSSLILILLAYLGQVEEPEGIVPGCAASALTEIPRRNRSGLTEEEFYQEHVLKGIPLLLFLDEPMPALDVFLSACADRKLNLLSKQQADVLQDLLDEELPLWQWLVSNFVLLLTTGSTARRWAQLRQATATELFEGPAAASFRGPPAAVRLLHTVAAFLDNKLLLHLSAVAKLISQPVYLADKVLDDICPALRPHAELSSYEQHAFERLQNRKVPWQTLQGIEDIGLRHESDARVFYGGPKSYSYPLHRDLPDEDVLCVLHSGCKDVVMLPPAARRRLERLQVPGARRRPFTWAYDFFSDSPLKHLKQGWAGTLRPGELLYMPGEMLHHIRNSCKHSFTICRRPWRATMARDVALETLKTLRLAAEEETHLGEALAALRARRARRKR
ncbi:unnamed protein product [Durusdinium trenchii]|uniref:JmjC domain-containing protein n=1 Tax=Durusdinium trenchii TaxID=1381693 RepID=A0ABP0PL85_9DINO